MITFFKNGWITLLAFSLSCLFVRAYAQKPSIILLTNPQKDKVELRWAPNTLALWQAGNKYGYKVERFLYSANGANDTTSYKRPELLTPSPLKPLPEAEWDKLAEHNDYAAVVQGLIYEKVPQPENLKANPTALIQYKNEMNTRFGFALFTCDLSIEVAQAHGLYFSDETAKQGNRYIYKISLAQVPKGLKYEPGADIVDPNEIRKLVAPRELMAEFGDSIVNLNWNMLYDKGSYSGYFIERSADGKTFVQVNDVPHVQVQMDKDRPSHLAFYRDSLLDNNQTYSYRVRGITPFASYGPYSNIVSGKGIMPLKGELRILKDSLMPNNQVFLQWQYQAENQEPVKSISIWRAPKAEGPFEEIKSFSPAVLHGVFIDTKPKKSNYYRFELKGMGSNKMQSIVALVTTIDSIPPVAPTNLKGSVDEQGVVVLTWDANKEDDLQGYRVFRANTLFEEPVEITTRQLFQNAYLDTVPLNTLDNDLYYFVMAMDDMYNPSDLSKPFLLVKPDTIPPAAPAISKFEYKDGNIILDFQPSYSKDVAWYTIYRKDLQTQSMVLLDSFGAKVKDFSVEDSIEDVGHKFKYRIIASDKSGNRVEVWSGDIDTETGRRPALKGFGAKADRTQQLIRLTWDYRGKEKLSSIHIYRARGQESMLLVKTLAYTGVNSIDDKEVEINNDYSYKIKGVFENEAETKISEPVKITY